jgi:hypothetical protein
VYLQTPLNWSDPPAYEEKHLYGFTGGLIFECVSPHRFRNDCGDIAVDSAVILQGLLCDCETFAQRLRCDSKVIAQRLRNDSTAILQQLPSISHRFCNDFAMIAEWNRSGFHSDSPAIALRLWSICACCAVILKGLRSDCATISKCFRSDSTAILQQLCIDFASIPQRSRNDCGEISQWIPQWFSSDCAVILKRLRNGFKVLSQDYIAILQQLRIDFATTSHRFCITISQWSQCDFVALSQQCQNDWEFYAQRLRSDSARVALWWWNVCAAIAKLVRVKSCGAWFQAPTDGDVKRRDTREEIWLRKFEFVFCSASYNLRARANKSLFARLRPGVIIP